MSTSLAESLLYWYQDHARSLPWRENPDPYNVWIAEVMLQQTRVETVLPYYERWLKRFPTIASLALASQQEILSEWEGLGYYSRARNLHLAAQLVMDEFGGKLPQDVKRLRQLPGIGRYTAGALASIAFGKDEPALDGNIRRVLARVFDVRQPSRSRESEERLWQLAATYLPPGQAGEYNQALMDLGALICTPRQPNCSACPLNETCLAYSLGVQSERPVKRGKKPVPHHTASSAIIQQDGQVLIAQRPPKGLLGGLWEFPGGKIDHGEDLVTGLKRNICEELDVEIEVGLAYGVYQHAYTHFRVTLHAYICELNGSQPHNLYHTNLAWTKPPSLANYPMGKIDRQISDALIDPPKSFSPNPRSYAHS
jgi:A/G-specific adenine glycosylase